MHFLSRADRSALRVHGATREEVREANEQLAWPDGRPSSSGKDAPRPLEAIEGRSKDWAQPLFHVGRRAFDILFSLTALLLTLPVMIGIVLAIRLSSPGPALYRHRRIGQRGRAFDCMKFRTMVMDADQILEKLLDSDQHLRDEFAQKYKLIDDPRITKVGRILRKTSLDELPQFWNVLKGHMSVVGPRPLVRDEMERYGPHLPLILSVRPGLTGLWQVSGRNDTTYEERVDLDRQYVLSQNIGRDMLIIFKTVRVMVSPRNGAY